MALNPKTLALGFLLLLAGAAGCSESDLYPWIAPRQSVARVSQPKNQVLVQRAGQSSWDPMKDGETVFAFDRVRLGQDSSATLHFSEGEDIELAPGSNTLVTLDMNESPKPEAEEPESQKPEPPALSAASPQPAPSPAFKPKEIARAPRVPKKAPAPTHPAPNPSPELLEEPDADFFSLIEPAQNFEFVGSVLRIRGQIEGKIRATLKVGGKIYALRPDHEGLFELKLSLPVGKQELLFEISPTSPGHGQTRRENRTVIRKR